MRKKGEKYVIKSHMTDKAVKKETESLIERLKYIQDPRNKFATHINLNCNKIQRADKYFNEKSIKGAA